MPKLLRPYIPLKIRCRVALRQVGWGAKGPRDQESSIDYLLRLHAPVRHLPKGESGYGRLLRKVLAELAEKLGCETKNLDLDHDPPLAAREKIIHKGIHIGYNPDANDERFLIYREKNAHRIKTNHAGEHGQFPDRVLIKRNRKLEGKVRAKVKRKIQGRGFEKGHRLLKSRGWPKKEKR